MKKVIILLVGMVAILGCQKQKQKILYVFNWTDYIATEIIENFEKDYHCKVVYDTYNSNENMLTKILNTQASYDICVPSGDHVGIMKEKGLLEKIDKSKLEFYNNLNPAILTKATGFDQDNDYAVPYFWGLTGIIYNKKNYDLEKKQKISWDAFSDSDLNGKNVVTMLDDPREVIGAALIYCGYSPNDISDAALDAAQKVLLQWDKNVSQYDSDSYKNEVQDGTTWLAQAYNGDALQIMAQNPEIGFVLPQEGSIFWLDSMVILKNSENKELAYKFIDYLLKAENAAKNAEYVQYATPNLAAYNLLSSEIKNNPNIYPPKAYLKKTGIVENIGENVLKFDKIWERLLNN